MNAMKMLGFSLLSAMTLAGCGGSNGNGQPAPYNPYQNNGQYNLPTATPFQCQAGLIQLRNAFGKPQCFQTANIAEACSQIGGVTQNNLCRQERLISGVARGKFRNNGQMAPDNIPVRVNLFPGEAVKIYGKIDSLRGDRVYWNAQLIQNGMALGSASGDTVRMSDISNLSIISLSTANSGQIGNQYAVQPQYQNQYQTQYQTTQYPNQNGIWNNGFYNQPAAATPNLLILQVMFEGKIKVELKASAISCEDGKGNSYPCN